MVIWPRASHGEQFDCLVELTWPASRQLWWRARHVGSAAQIAAALDELAVRVGIDPLARTLLLLDQAHVGYSLAVWVRSEVIEHRADTVELTALPAVLRAHAGAVRVRVP